MKDDDFTLRTIGFFVGLSHLYKRLPWPYSCGVSELHFSHSCDNVLQLLARKAMSKLLFRSSLGRRSLFCVAVNSSGLMSSAI